MISSFRLRGHVAIYTLLKNISVRRGRQKFSEAIFLETIRLIRLQFPSPASLILKVINDLSYPVGLRPKQVAATKVYIPSPLPIRQQRIRAIRWVVEGARKRDRFNRLQPRGLADEFLANFKKESTHSRKQLNEFFRQVVDNRPSMRFVH